MSLSHKNKQGLSAGVEKPRWVHSSNYMLGYVDASWTADTPGLRYSWEDVGIRTDPRSRMGPVFTLGWLIPYNNVMIIACRLL